MVFIGIALPPLGALLKPYVSEAVFALLVLAFLLVEPEGLRAQIKRPWIVIAISFWTMAVMPALLGSLYLLIGTEHIPPALFLALVLQAAASPLMSSPAIAALLGLDAALVLAGMVLCTSVVPLTAPFFMRLFVGDVFSISPVTLGVKLFAMLAGAALVATLIRRFAGRDRVVRQKEIIDGLNVIVLFIFVAALMGDIAEQTIANPLLVLGLIVLSFILTLGPLALTAAVFATAGNARSFALGLMASQRNMGLMLAAAGGSVPELTWLYFALAQFPIYLLPQFLKPLARRIHIAS